MVLWSCISWTKNHLTGISVFVSTQVKKKTKNNPLKLILYPLCVIFNLTSTCLRHHVADVLCHQYGLFKSQFNFPKDCHRT